MLVLALVESSVVNSWVASLVPSHQFSDGLIANIAGGIGQSIGKGVGEVLQFGPPQGKGAPKAAPKSAVVMEGPEILREPTEVS